MAEKDPIERSLFSRIKDCVLMELARKPNEPEKSPCPSRSIWGWKIEPGLMERSEKGRKLGEHQADDSKAGAGAAGQHNNEHGGDNDTTNKNSDDSSSRGGGGGGGGGGGEQKQESREKSGKEESLKGSSNDAGDKNVKDENENQANSISGHDNTRKEINADGGSSRGHEHSMGEEKSGVKKGAGDESLNKRHDDGKIQDNERITTKRPIVSDQQDSCGSNTFKPVQYYIKMQDPEAPICCESIASRKICPPKTKKGKKQDTSDGYKMMRPTCQCEACSTSA